MTPEDFMAEGFRKTDGPWHHGHAVTCEVLGTYVTIVCSGSPDVLSGIVEYITGKPPRAPPDEVMVGRVPEAPQKQRRKILRDD